MVERVESVVGRARGVRLVATNLQPFFVAYSSRVLLSSSESCSRRGRRWSAVFPREHRVDDHARRTGPRVHPEHVLVSLAVMSSFAAAGSPPGPCSARRAFATALAAALEYGPPLRRRCRGSELLHRAQRHLWLAGIVFQISSTWTPSSQSLPGSLIPLVGSRRWEPRAGHGVMTPSLPARRRQGCESSARVIMSSPISERAIASARQDPGTRLASGLLAQERRALTGPEREQAGVARLAAAARISRVSAF